MGLSRRAYARHRGCTENAVRKAIASGRITVEADGKIDPAKADAQWAAHTDPSQQRGVHAPNESASGNAPNSERKAVPKAAMDAVQETLNESGEAGDGGEMTLVRARLANEVIKAHTARVRLNKMKGELVDRSKAQATIFALARRERDAWINWPARVAALMAAELGVDPHAMESALEKYVRQQLEDQAELKIDLR